MHVGHPRLTDENQQRWHVWIEFRNASDQSQLAVLFSWKPTLPWCGKRIWINCKKVRVFVCQSKSRLLWRLIHLRNQNRRLIEKCNLCSAKTLNWKYILMFEEMKQICISVKHIRRVVSKVEIKSWNEKRSKRKTREFNLIF